MKEEKNYISSIDELNLCLQKYENIVVYGAGDYGKRVIDYIISINKENKIAGIVVTERGTDYEYKGLKIYEASNFLEKSGGDYVINAVSPKYWYETAKVIEQYGKNYCHITQELYWEMGRQLQLDSRIVVPYKGLDFLLVGFVKCGTTSLYRTLYDNIKEIYLSERKESQFFSWCDKVENPEEVLIKNYFDNIKEGQIVGMIEPTFAKEAERIHHYFGEKFKIIFLVRNPVESMFSNFKMMNREGLCEFEEVYRKWGGEFSAEMFDEYFEKETADGRCIQDYIYWIEQFWKYYPKEQVKIVLFEDLVRNPQIIINDILKFIGVSSTYEDNKLPRVNEGKFVMADIEGYKIAKLRKKFYREKKILGKEGFRENDEKTRLYMEIEEKYAQAKKIYDLKMTTEQRMKAEKYFSCSVRKLEKALDRDLSEVWF